MLYRTVVLRIGLAVALLTACANNVVAYGGDGGAEGGRFQGFRSSRTAGARHDPRTCPQCRAGGESRSGGREAGGPQGGEERFSRGPRGTRSPQGGGAPDCAECASAGKRGGRSGGAWSSPSARSRTSAGRGGWGAERAPSRSEGGSRGSWRSARSERPSRGDDARERMAVEGDRY